MPGKQRRKLTINYVLTVWFRINTLVSKISHDLLYIYIQYVPTKQPGANCQPLSYHIMSPILTLRISWSIPLIFGSPSHTDGLIAMSWIMLFFTRSKSPIYLYTYIPIYIHTYHNIPYHTITLHYITLYYIPLHYITLLYLHYITLHCITLHYITLHIYIYTYIHIYTYTYIHLYNTIYIYIYIYID